MDNELAILEHYIEETRSRIEARRRLRESNQQENIEYPEETSLNNLDSSIKKNSAFVKRLKVYSESQRTQIFDEIGRLNLTKFISEVVGSIIEAKLKLSDVPSVIEICSKLNQTYKDFSGHLIDQYSKYFPTVKRKPNIDSPSLIKSGTHHLVSYSASPSHSSNLTLKGQVRNVPDNINLNPSKIRVDLRLFTEFIVSGIVPLKESFPILVNLLCYLMVYDKNSHQNASAILTFCKGFGDEFAGIVPPRMQKLAAQCEKEIPTSGLIPAKRQVLLRNYIREYYQSLLKHLNDLHDELANIIARNQKICKSKVELTKESREIVEVKRVEYQKSLNVVGQLGDLLGEESPPALDIDNATDDFISGDLEFDMLVDTSSPNNFIWDDEGTKNFYEDLPDLKAMFPNLVERVAAPKKVEGVKEDGARRESSERKSDESSTIPSLDSLNKNGNDEDDDSDKTIGCSSSESSSNEAEVNDSSKSSSMVMRQDIANRVQPDQYYVKLSNCVNRDMIDNAAIDFIKFFNTKFGRRKLIKTLFNVQRTRLDLLPFFARLTASIYRYVPSVGNELVSLLKSDFKSLFKKKDQINIESKVKNVRFIGELVKFNLYSKSEALYCLKILLSDFTHHHIEMTCNMLETCGRYLYKSPDSHHQLRLLLEQMMRKKLLLSVDSKYVTMIENAYYFTNPPEVTRQLVEEPPIQLYVRYLLYECLSRSTIDKVLTQLKKLDWHDRQLAKFVINCMIEAYHVKFYNIRYLAALLSSLNKDHQWISIAVVDGVVEDILLMLEINELQFNQRRIPMIRYFGELYNYRLSDSSLVFKVLYSLITYAIHYPNAEQNLAQIPMSKLDPPDNLFRVKLVCDLLDTCGQYLNSGPEKKKLDCYLLFFQRYYWLKKHIYMLHPYCMVKSGNQFPASVEFMYNDAIHNLRPKFKMAYSYEEATQAVQGFINSLNGTQRNHQQSARR